MLIRSNGVQALLMGGRACVFYGAAQFSRDIDLVLLPDPENYQSGTVAPVGQLCIAIRREAGSKKSVS